MREYETVFILHPGLEDQQVEEEIEGVRKAIEAGSGEIVCVERWGRRKLAYEIRKAHEGIYTLIRFRSDVGVFQELERRYRLRENVLRYLTIIAHGPSPEPPAPKPEKEETPEPAADSETEAVRPEPVEKEEVKEPVASDDNISGITPETISTSEGSEGSAKTPTVPEADSQPS